MDTLFLELEYYQRNAHLFERSKKHIVSCHGEDGYNWICDQINRQPKPKKITKCAVLRKYTRSVRKLTERQPLHGLKGFSERGFFGMHVDHIVSIRQAFKLGWPVEKCADISNLQMLDRDENMKKSNTSYCKWQPKNNDLVCQKLF